MVESKVSAIGLEALPAHAMAFQASDKIRKAAGTAANT